ncbi:MAG: MarR family winged helix-turn-helix transcriptional regulator [Myxococcaceae bacterium]
MPPLLRIPGALDSAWSWIPDACLCSAARMLSRYASRPLDRMLAGHGITLTEFQLMVTLRDAPARAVELARRLRLDPGPTARALLRLEERGVVRRAFRWRFSEWVLAPEGAMHLELLEPGWIDLNAELHWNLGAELPGALVRVIDHLHHPVPREHQGWSD